jgi:putative phage-type endonuclease
MTLHATEQRRLESEARQYARDSEPSSCHTRLDYVPVRKAGVGSGVWKVAYPNLANFDGGPRVTPEQREAWLAERRTGIGGSDAAAAIGLSKWKTQLALYLDKRGELEVEENEPMRWGNLLEPVVRQEYANRTGRTVVVPTGIIRHPSVEFALMTPDGIADGCRVLQVKTARSAEGWGEPGTGEIPLDYLIQVQHEMFVTLLPVADVAVLIGGSDFRIYVVEADAELQGMLMEQEAAFWQCVKRSQPPAPVNGDDVKRRWKICRGGKVAANDADVARVNKLAAAKRVAKELETLIESETAALQLRMGDAAELTNFTGDALATWKQVTTNPRFDVERFKAEQPELHKQYLK